MLKRRSSWGPESRLDPHLGVKRAGRLVLFHVVLGAFHIDLLLSRKFRADLIKHRGTGRKNPVSLDTKTWLRLSHSGHVFVGPSSEQFLEEPWRPTAVVGF